ncbi:hypothetical protein [Crossiella sp. CA198]|uniref:hypothetical protein n=1 Tax=Crossiella sp. CA198 TaxID=3455607 RepID=UPI003F8D1243
MAGEFQLQLYIGKVAVLPAPALLTDALQSAKVISSARDRTGFQLTFAVSRNSPITTTLLPAGALDPETRIILVALVRGLPQVLVDGVITTQSMNPGTEPGTATLTITGEDLLVLLDMVKERDGHLFLPPDLQVSKILAKEKYFKYGILPGAVPAVIPEIPDLAGQGAVQTDSDLDYIEWLARKAGYTFYLIPNRLPGTSVAYWGPEIRIGVPQPALTVDSGTATNVESLSFTMNGLARTRWTMDITIPFTKLTRSVAVPDLSLLRPPLALRPAPQLKEAPLPSTANKSFAEVSLLGLAATAKEADAVTAEGSLDVLRYGHILRSRELVGVRGAGFAYDGLYYVTSVTHDLQRGQYKQTFSLSRDGLVSLTQQVPT